MAVCYVRAVSVIAEMRRNTSCFPWPSILCAVRASLLMFRWEPSAGRNVGHRPSCQRLPADAPFLRQTAFGSANMFVITALNPRKSAAVDVLCSRPWDIPAHSSLSTWPNADISRRGVHIRCAMQPALPSFRVILPKSKVTAWLLCAAADIASISKRPTSPGIELQTPPLVCCRPAAQS